MKERPILFSARDVRALLDGLKTQDRRQVRLPRNWVPNRDEIPDMLAGALVIEPRGIAVTDLTEDTYDLLPCPYGAPGDRLWVRETWGLRRKFDVTDWYRGPIGGASEQEWTVDFRADFGSNQEACFWRPSIHMPRWAARLVLELASVRVERLQAITEADAVAEGHLARVHPAEWTALRPLPGFAGSLTAFGREPSASVIAELGLTRVRYEPERVTSARDRFRLHHLETSPGRRLWASNPWVWVLGLRRVTP